MIWKNDVENHFYRFQGNVPLIRCNCNMCKFRATGAASKHPLERVSICCHLKGVAVPVLKLFPIKSILYGTPCTVYTMHSNERGTFTTRTK